MPISEQRRQHGVVELVAAAHRTIETDQRQPGERQIAHHIENLVANALIGVAQALGVEYAGLIDHHGIFERSAERVACAPELVDIAHAAKNFFPQQQNDRAHKESVRAKNKERRRYCGTPL